MASLCFSTASALGLLALLLLPCGATELFFAVDADPFLGRVVASRASVHAAIEASLQATCVAGGGGDGGDGGEQQRGEEGGGDLVEARLLRTQRQLSAAYASLPKNGRGRLASAGVRYLLHRHFLHRRAWLVQGLAPAGGAWNTSFPSEILKDWVPAEVQQVVAEHLQGRGLLLREVAVLATMLENQVRADAIDRLQAAYRALGLDPQAAVKAEELEEALDLHTMTYMVEGLLQRMVTFRGRMPRASLKAAQRAVRKGYPTWPRTQGYLRRTLAEVAPSPRGLGFEVAKNVAVQAIEQYGGWQDQECRELKHDLLALEARPGRVELRTFYGEALSGRNWQFSESVSYLRTLGVLDESDPVNPSVLVPNYMGSPSNYIASSHLFAVVCIDECEDLLNHIERRLGAPEALAREVVSVVSSLPSASQPARGLLDDVLLRELDGLAAMHGGRVPIHGRLFALWMHRAYPRDCPYPHVAGEAKEDMLPAEFVSSTGLPYLESREAMLRWTSARQGNRTKAPQAAASEVERPWDAREELLRGRGEERPGLLSSAAGLWRLWATPGHGDGLAAGVAALALLGLAAVVGRARPLQRARPETLSGAQGPLLDSGVRATAFHATAGAMGAAASADATGVAAGSHAEQMPVSN